MDLRSIESVERLLNNTRLLTPQQISECRSDVAPGMTPQDYLRLLERKQYLTSFQGDRIRKGDVAGLVLGGCKLMYRNASGSFARVYRAMRIESGEMIGMKVLRDRWSKDPDTVKLFRHEGQVGQKLRHPNIVPIFEVDEEDGFHFITMEFVEGGNLRDFIKIRQQLEPVEACRYGLDIARALDYAIRQHSLTHRDMKTTNVLMSSQGVAKVIDFGLAAEESYFNRPGAPELAQAVEYTTLERHTNAPRNDPRSDLYFLGTILYELLTGEPPYPRTRDIEERKRFGRYRDVRPISSVMPQLDWNVAGVIEQLLQISPEHRFQSASEVASSLERVLVQLGHRPTPAGTTAPRERAGSSSDAKTILCVEPREKRQDILRDYFSKHGFRLLIVTDPDRALARVKNNPPDGLILFEDAIGLRAVQDFQLVLRTAPQLGVLLVLSAEFDGDEQQLQAANPKGRVLRQPIRLRDLRQALEQAVGVESP